MMYHDEAFASDDAVLADWLSEIWKTRTTENGDREIFDPAAGLWRNDQDTVDQVRERERRRAVLGSERDTNALNRYERALGMQ